MGRTCVRRLRVVMLMALGAVAMANLAGRGGAGQTGPAFRETYVVVQTGDSLWTIARALGGPGSDPRPLVDRLIAANGLRGALIQPGQRLRVPGE